MKKEDQMNKKKEIVLTKYPYSDYAAIILDPDAFAKKNETNDEASPAYAIAYNLYAASDYTGCMGSCVNAFSQYKSSGLMHRFALLKALCIDKISGRDSFKVELRNVIDAYKGTESAQTARRLLDVIEGKKENIEDPEINTKINFEFNATAEHFVIIYLPDATKKVDAAIGKIIEFNDMEFEGKEYSITNSILPQTGQVILIRKFTNSTEALQYIAKYDEKGMVLKINFNSPSKIMAISALNFATLIKTPSMAEYQNFYSTNYK